MLVGPSCGACRFEWKGACHEKGFEVGTSSCPDDDVLVGLSCGACRFGCDENGFEVEMGTCPNDEVAVPLEEQELRLQCLPLLLGKHL